jgi:hypothetical protein
LKRSTRSLLETTARRQVVLHEMNDGFGVGLGMKANTLRDQLILEFEEVLDYAVMDDHHTAGLPKMRMRIPSGRCSVRGPARVSYAGGATNRRALYELYKLRQLAGVLAHLKGTVVQDGQPGRVIAAILKLL